MIHFNKVLAKRSADFACTSTISRLAGEHFLKMGRKELLLLGGVSFFLGIDVSLERALARGQPRKSDVQRPL